MDTDITQDISPADAAAESPAADDNRYPFQQIERKWQARWADAAVYRTTEGDARPKYYVLDMFPYPSGSGLHVGHCRNYVPGDAVARLMHMKGHNVLHPMGWDAFGQPAEQDAIKRNVNPRNVVPILAAEYKRQFNLLGVGYDWDREINSTDPAYYKWNQWAFLLLLERGLAYRKAAPVNWCVNESTVLANEEVADGKCWRCDGPVVKKDLPQWFFQTTAYGDKLLEGLDKINWPEGIKTQQRDWIGRSEGVEFDIAVENSETARVRVFTTRVDTIFGMSFVVLSPEHALVSQITTPAQQAEVEAYVARAARLSDMDRADEKRERTGVFTGAYGVNPASGGRVPIYIADYVLTGYGTGAIMAVPAHDTRDFEFARCYDLPTPIVIVATLAEAGENTRDTSGDTLTEAWTAKDGYTVNSGQFSGLPVKVAAARIAEWLESDGVGERKVNFRLRDWLVSRQRYWGTPIPIIHCPACGIVPVPLADLPVLLPDVENYKPGPDGRSPLAEIATFVNVTCPTCGKAAQRETDTMAGSVDSSWYFLRFASPHEDKEAWDRAASDYWLPVDQYIGGREHAVGHLLYARFFTKIFFDAGLIGFDEPFSSLRNQGMLLAETPVDKVSSHVILPDEMDRFPAEQVEYQWLKMSKGKRNTVTPDEIAERYGSDALRLYVLFVAPFEDTIQWSEEKMNGTFRFLNRLWDTVSQIVDGGFTPHWPDHVGAATSDAERALRRATHIAIARVGDDIAQFRFNTAVSGLMIHLDVVRKFVSAHGVTSPAAHEAGEMMVKLIAPLAPHIADELWERLGYTDAFLYRVDWPVSDPALAAQEEITLVVQVNGKLKDRVPLSATASAEECEAAARASDKVQAELAGKTVRKVIVVPGKLVNIVAS